MNQQQLKEAAAYNEGQIQDEDLTPGHFVRMIQFWQEAHDLKPDGWAGPLTQKNVLNSINQEWEVNTLALQQPAPNSQFVDGKWLPWNGPADSQPWSGQQIQYFGNPETAQKSNVMSKNWYRKNIIECHQSQGNRLPGIPAKFYIKVHRMVEPYLREALRRVAITCSDYPIYQFGSYRFRHMRNNPNRSMSMHSFGVAFDVNSDDNSGMHYDRGKSPKAYDERYMKRWPKGVSAAFVQCFTSCGFAWGSDWDEDGKTDDHTYLDPMHFEWVARDGVNLEV